MTEKFLAIFFAMIFVIVSSSNELTLDDVSRLNQTKVRRIIQVQKASDIYEGIAYAIKHKHKLTIAGKRHSQGGHIVYKDGVVLDMSSFDQVLSIDPQKRVITVQSGISWAQIQEAVNSLQLAVKVMQSSNIFSIGGSISVNAHGRDPRYGPMIETINQMDIMLFDGTVKTISRNKNSNLFQAVIGGYGLFGVILDAEIQLTTNQILQKVTDSVSYTEYPNHLRQKVIRKTEVHLHYGRLSIVPGDGFLREGYATRYISTSRGPDRKIKLVQEKWIKRNRYFFGISRKHEWGKKFRWKIQKEYYSQ